MEPPDAKRELRKRMRTLRRDIAADPEDRTRRSQRISERVVAVLASRHGDRTPTGRRLMVYVPLVGEPDLAPLRQWAEANRWHLFVPEVDGTDLRVEPGDIDPATLDVVVVPGLAFTRDGHRLGQGGGHFDRFLTRLAPDALTIGVAFHEQLVERLPVEAHDVALDVVVSDD